MTEKNSGEEKKKSGAEILKRIFLWLVAYKKIVNLLKYNNRLLQCSKIVPVSKIRVDNFKNQVNRVRLALFYAITPFLIAVTYHVYEYKKHHHEFNYLDLVKLITLRDPVKCVEAFSSNPSFILSLLSLLVSYILLQINLTLLNKNYEVANKTELMLVVLKKLNVTEPELLDRCLWTKIGVLIELSSSTATELVKHAGFWIQIDMQPGEIIYSKEKKLFFVLSGFELADSYDFNIKD